MKKAYLVAAIVAAASVLLPLGIASAQTVTTPYFCGTFYSSIPCNGSSSYYGSAYQMYPTYYGSGYNSMYYNNGYVSTYPYQQYQYQPYQYQYPYYNYPYNYPGYNYGGNAWSLCYQGSLMGGTTYYYPCMYANQQYNQYNGNNYYYNQYPYYYGNGYNYPY